MRRIQFDIDENDDTTGVKAISIVDDPAIDSNFVTLSKEATLVELAGPYKQILAGLALIPDKDIPRRTPNGEPYVAYFTKEGIERIRNKFHKELMNNKVNVDHKQDKFINAYMVESFIVDSDHRIEDLKAKGIKDAVKGAWFVAYKIEDKEVFAKALAGEFKGFSVEIFIKNLFEKPKEEDSIKSTLDSLNSKLDEILKSAKADETSPAKLNKDKLKKRLSLINHELNHI